MRLRFLFAVLLLWYAAAAAGISYRLQFSLFPDAEGWALRGSATVTARAPATVDALVFRFFQGEEAPPDIRGITAGEAELAWDAVDPTAVAVEYPLEEGQTFAVTFSYAVDIPPFPGKGYGILTAGGDTVAVARAYPILAPWREGWVVEPIFPWGDPVVAEVGDYTVEVACPPGWEPVATGEEVKLSPGRYRVAGDNLREFFLVLLSGYEHIARELDGIELNSFVLPEHRDAGEEALRLAADALELYGDLFGAYPFPELDVVEVPLVEAAGVEFPGLILAGRDHYARYLGGAEKLFFPMIFAHEVAHQWWYAQVGSDQVREPWVDEALATYTSGLAMAEWGLFDELRAYWERTWALGHARNPSATVFSPLWDFPDGRGYGGIVYSGGALFFLDLERAMGRERLIAALRRYLEEFRWRIATGEDLLGIIAAAGGAPAAEVIRKWRRGGPP